MSEMVDLRQISQADVEYAVELLNHGDSTETVIGKLVDRGMKPEVASALLDELFARMVYADALAMLDQGNRPEQVKRQLVEKGLDKIAAAAVVDDILAQSRAARREGAGTRLLLRCLGGVVIVLGIGLYFGNRSGAFATFPFAGFVVMGIGSMIWGAARVS